MQCLAKLGEVPRREHGREMMRVLDLGSGREEHELLENLRRAWPATGKGANKLFIDVPAKSPDQDKKPDQEPAKEQAPPENRPPAAPADSRPAVSRVDGASRGATSALPGTISEVPNGLVELARFNRVTVTPSPLPPAVRPTVPAEPRTVTSVAEGPQADAASDASEKPKRAHFKRQAARQADDDTPSDNERPAEAESRPGASGDPIFISRGADGHLMMTSRDTQALDQLEEMIAKMAPPRKDYAVFYLKYTTASSMKWNLDDFFATEKKETPTRRPWWWDDDNTNKKEDSPRLSSRKPLRFIDDAQTNSLLVQGASAEQLRRIDELIKLYDRPEMPNSKVSRMTKIFSIQHFESDCGCRRHQGCLPRLVQRQ